MTKKMIVLLLVLVMMMFVLNGCGTEKESMKAGLEDLAEMAEDLEEAVNDEALTEEQNSEDQDEAENEADAAAEPDKLIVQSWPEKGYESLPKLEKGNTIWFSDSGVSFNVTNENVSKKDFEDYQKLLLDKGYVLMNNTDTNYNYMLGDASNAKSTVGIIYDGSNILTVSGAGN